MVAQQIIVQLEDVSDELVVGSECLCIAPRSAGERGPLRKNLRGAGPRVSPRSWAEYVDHLGKIDNRRLRRVDARHQAPSHIRHADESFRWSEEVAG